MYRLPRGPCPPPLHHTHHRSSPRSLCHGGHPELFFPFPLHWRGGGPYSRLPCPRCGGPLRLRLLLGPVPCGSVAAPVDPLVLGGGPCGPCGPLPAPVTRIGPCGPLALLPVALLRLWRRTTRECKTRLCHHTGYCRAILIEHIFRHIILCIILRRLMLQSSKIRYF